MKTKFLGVNKEEILKEIWGHEEFRLRQSDVIQNVLDGKSTLGIMPTGGGKSVCFQIPALATEGLTIVISPLLSLMRDQVETLQKFNIPVETLNSEKSPEEQKNILKKLENDELKLLYISPERAVNLLKQIEVMPNVKVAQVAVDEAHCISQWGHDFRKDYAITCDEILRLGYKVIALTATADEKTKDDIQYKLRISDDNVFISSFRRENLEYNASKKIGDGLAQVKTILKSSDTGSKIIYCNTTKSVDLMNDALNHAGIKSCKYHGKMDQAEKDKSFTDFMGDKVDVIVATTAFGMGIDKPDVRIVINYDVPYSLEDYYQQTGRAGRDGKDSKVYCLYDKSTILKNAVWLKADSPKKADKFFEVSKIVTGSRCIMTSILEGFGEESSHSCNNCSVCKGQAINKNFAYDVQSFAKDLIDLIDNKNLGINSALDVLIGSKNGKAANFQKEHSFGMYKIGGMTMDSSKEYGKSIAQDLVINGFLIQEAIDGQSHMTNMLVSKKGLDLLKSKVQLNLDYIETPDIGSKTTVLKPVSKRRRRNVTPTENQVAQKKQSVTIIKEAKAPINNNAINTDLYNVLSNKRDEIAKSRNLPYEEYWKVLSNKLIENIAKENPSNESDLKKVKGINESKFEFIKSWVMEEIDSNRGIGR